MSGPTERTQQKPDPEVVALETCFNALKDLEHDEQNRILHYLGQRFAAAALEKVGK